MFAIAIRYLNGRAAAASVSNREAPEWPPHPDRLFMALTAAWGTGGRSLDGEESLRWLEALGSPEVTVAPIADQEATSPSYFVPVNAPKNGKLVGHLREKKERSFPSVVPAFDTIFFCWPNAELDAARSTALNALCANVTYIGHSSSLVQAWLASDAPPPTHVPNDDAPTHWLRVPRPGRLDTLEASFHAQRFPPVGAWQGYVESVQGTTQAVARTSAFGEMFVLRRTSGPPLGLQSSLLLTRAVRGALLSIAGDDAPEYITGHGPGGAPSQRTHIAVLPMADVGHEHADGHLLGFAVLLPAGLAPTESEVATRIVAALLDRPIVMGSVGEWRVTSEKPHEPTRRALDKRTWTASTRRWASVTPIILDRYPRDVHDAEESIALACERQGLPRPREVTVMQVSPHLGVPAARDFPAEAPRNGKPLRWHTHALLSFDVSVAGPMVLGAGRYRGYGLLRPLGGMR